MCILRQEEIQEKLHDLNLTTLAPDRQKKRKWFDEHGVQLIEIETTFHILPQYIDQREFTHHLLELNIHLLELKNHLTWFKEQGLLVEMKKIEETQRYYYIKEYPNFNPEKRRKVEQE